MSTSTISTISPGAEVLLHSSKAWKNLWTGPVEKKYQVLGREVNGQLPVKVTTFNNSNQPSYTLSSEAFLSDLVNAKKARLQMEAPLDAKDENILRLWQFWKQTVIDKTPIQDKLLFWANFDEEGNINSIQDTPSNSNSYVQLMVSDDSLDLGPRNNMPINFYEQLEIFNWLLSELTISSKLPSRITS